MRHDGRDYEPEDSEEQLDTTASESAPTGQELEALAERYKKVTGEELPRGSQYPHAGNIAKKLRDHQGAGTGLSETIDEILGRYTEWRAATFAAVGDDEEGIIARKVAAFESYHSFLDTDAVDGFDSRGALVSSALEEFCYYLLQPILAGFSGALVGKQDTYQGMYFTASNFQELLQLPTVNTPVNTLDFIIGADLTGTVTADAGAREFPIRLPAVAVECKGYLDRPRFIESQNMARAIKSAFPQCRYILVAQCLKLNLKKIGVMPDIDNIYVWRRMQNIDRKVRRKDGTPLDPIHVPAVKHFYDTIKRHLTTDWEMAAPYSTGILK